MSIKLGYDAAVTTVAARRRIPAHERAAVRLVVLAEWAFTVAYVGGVLVALVRAADIAGHWYIPGQGDAFTADADIAAGRWWFIPVGLLVSSAPIAAGLGLFSSAMLFLLGFGRGDRRLVMALILSTLVTTLVLAASLTPPAQSLSGWLLD